MKSATPRSTFTKQAFQRDACVDDRSRRAALSQRPGQGGETLPHGPRADGEPQRAHRRDRDDARQRVRRTQSRSRHDPRCCPGERQITLGADKGYDTADFVAELRAMNVTPHVAAKVKSSAIDGEPRDTRATSSASASQGDRGSLRLGQDGRHGRQDDAARHGPCRLPVHAQMAAYNLARLPKLLAT